MRSFNVLLLLAVPMSLSAQAVIHTTVTSPMPKAAGVCPVSFGIELSSHGSIRVTQSAQAPQKNPRLDLTFHLQDTPEIASMRVVVHGLTGNWHVSAANPHSEETTQSFELNRPDGAKQWTHASLQVTKLPFVNSAEITEITYVNRSMWHPSGDVSCQASPNPLQLIAASH